MVMTTIIKNELPTRFQTWCEMYQYMKDRIQPDYTEIKYAEHGLNTVWEFRVDFIKARCFEEVLKFYPHTENTDYGGPEWQWEMLEKYRVFEKKTKLA